MRPTGGVPVLNPYKYKTMISSSKGEASTGGVPVLNPDKYITMIPSKEDEEFHPVDAVPSGRLRLGPYLLYCNV